MLYRFILGGFILLSTVAIAISADKVEPVERTIPKADVDRWSARIRLLVPNGWTVVSNGNDIVIQRNKIVQWASAEINGQALTSTAPSTIPQPTTERTYRLTLRLAPKLSMDEYEHLAAANVATQKVRDTLALNIADIPHKFDDYIATTPDETRRLAAFREADAKFRFYPLPDLYCTDYSIKLEGAEDGFSYVYEPDVASECENVKQAVLRFFGMYDPHQAADAVNRTREMKP